MPYTIFVINLSISIERKKNISQQLERLKLDYKIFPAVNGKDGHDLLSMYNDKLSHKYRGRSLTAGQLGCYASHYLLWQECIKLNKPIIIIEDDAIISPEPMLDFMQKIPTLPREMEFIRLHKHQRKKYSSQKNIQTEKLEIHRFNKGHMGTIGYFITPKAAEKFLLASNEWVLPVDIMMDRFWHTKVECFGSIPACITHDDVIESDIGYGVREPKTLLISCKREYFNFTELVKRSLHNFIYNLTYKQGK